MAARLRGLQKSDGYWPPSLLAPENSPPETRGTGFYVYGKAGRLGWVQQVSDRPDAVAETDTQFYGVGAFLLAASAVASITEG